MKLTKDEITAEALKPLIGKEMIVLTPKYPMGSIASSLTATQRQDYTPNINCLRLERLSPSGEYAEFGHDSAIVVAGNVFGGWMRVDAIEGIEVLA